MRIVRCEHMKGECSGCRYWDECESPSKEHGNPLWAVLIAIVFWAVVIYWFI